jgi:hypothetical protein
MSKFVETCKMPEFYTPAEKEQMSILRNAKAGDILHVRSKSFFGYWIRRMLSLGMNRCWGNHNAPIYADANGRLHILQIEAPAAYEMLLADYLCQTYEKGGRVLLLRPDVLCKRRSPKQTAGIQYATERWRSMIGMEYDKHSIRMFVRMVFRKSAHIEENTKERIYCTEGTLDALVYNPHLNWQPDMLKNETYPAPIHVEHLLRQERIVYVAGDEEGFEMIVRQK